MPNLLPLIFNINFKTSFHHQIRAVRVIHICKPAVLEFPTVQTAAMYSSGHAWKIYMYMYMQGNCLHGPMNQMKWHDLIIVKTGCIFRTLQYVLL